MGYIGPKEPAVNTPGSVGNSTLADVAQYRIKGRVSSGSGSPEDLTADQSITLLNQASTSTLDAARLSSYYRTIRIGGGADLTQRPRVNYISGSGITVTGADDGTDFESDITIALSSIDTNRVLGNVSGSSAAPGALDSDGLFTVLNSSGTATLNNNRLQALTPDPSGSYTYAGITVDAQGRVTAASNGTAPAVLGTAQTFTAGQRGEVTALTSASTVTIDMADSNNFSLTLAHSVTLANPSNLTAGQSGAVVITQASSGGPYTVAYGTYWKFPGGTVPTMTATASSVCVILYYVESSTRITAQMLNDVKVA